MINFYKENGFKLFPCKMDKSPNLSTPGLGWRDPKAHLSYEDAQDLMERGHLIGAWIPEDFIVVDIDRNHTDKQGNVQEDGLKVFKDLCTTHNLQDLNKKTLVVKTGSGGFHLYFKVSKKLSQRDLAESINTRTHSGYVIACGSTGYTVHNQADPIDLPEPFFNILDRGKDSTIRRVEPTRPLSPKLLSKVLSKIDVTHFRNNDEWLEFTMAIISTAGNSSEVLNIVAEWSESDPAYEGDDSIRARLDSFSPDGGITPGTFLYILKKEGLSPYMRQQVRKEIGVEFNLQTEQLIDHYDLPFQLNVDQLSDRIGLAKSFFYTRDQASTTRLIEYLVKDRLIYSRGEKEYYYFNGSRWQLWSDSLTLIYNILVIVADECFIRFGEQEGSDGIETLNDVLHIVGSVSWRQKIDTSLRCSEIVSKQHYNWDSPEIMETLTFEDGVLDFTSGELVSRAGRPEEYRRSFIDLRVEDVMEAGSPDSFKEVLIGIFPNKETRKTAVQALSLSVSGTGKYRKFQIWNGHGNNGKSFLKTVMEAVVGERAITYDSDILLQKTRSGEDPSAVTPGVARFQGALLAMSSETEEGKKISQGIVKNMTGDEKITANPKYKDEISFHTTFQLILATNYLPVFSAYDDAFINRLLVLPFTTSFYTNEKMKEKFEKQRRKYIVPAKNPNELREKILEERAAVLKFLVKTYISFDDIFIADECKALLRAYISENNDLGKFLDTFTSIEDDSFVATKYLVEFYNLEHNTHVTVQWMGRRLRQLHPELRDGRKRIDGTMQRGFYGMKLNKDGNEEEQF